MTASSKRLGSVSFLRTLLVLGRVSNLPTVWSNCLAGWWLGGAGNVDKLPYLLAGTTFLYTGGMFLNDAFDVEFDRQYRTERPIPARAIGLKAVWVWGVAWLAVGTCCLAWTGAATGALGLALALCIVVYDVVHKRVSFGPVLMGLCRFLLYLVAASAAANGLNSKVIICAAALFSYIVGLSYVARGESRSDAVKTVEIGSGPGPTSLKQGVNEIRRHCPIAMLAMPLIVTLIVNRGYVLESAVLLSAIFLVWTVRSLRYTLWTDQPSIGRTVSGLLAGIVWVDLLAASNLPRELGAVFVGLFLAALLFQRFVPAT